MAFDEKAFEAEIKRQQFIDARPVASFEKGSFIPEVMVAGANWIVGPAVKTRDDALKIAQIHVEAIRAALELTVEQYIASQKLKKAKA